MIELVIIYLIFYAYTIGPEVVALEGLLECGVVGLLLMALLLVLLSLGLLVPALALLPVTLS
jgi:hypothetical protein